MSARIPVFRLLQDDTFEEIREPNHQVPVDL